MEKYQKVRVLGKGSFGSAILIKRKTDGSLFVVKEVSLLKMNKKERDEARHECTVLQALQHPNIVRYTEHFENHNNLYIVMEYCDGGDLSQKIKQTRGAMKESMIMYYFSQVCLAMEYLHSRHILHRDIKTMNVFLMKNGAVKLGDFGISTVLRNTMGMANTVCGTPYYFSPELCRNKPYNNKSDIWALGVLLYECASGGRHPFDGTSMNQLMQRIVRGTYAPLSSSYSSEFRRLVDWCLQKEPAKRPSIKQTLALPLMRRVLEQLEEDLMLATQCRVRLKDIIDFDVAGGDGADSSAAAKGAGPGEGTPATELPKERRGAALQPGVSPGQAAALAMAKLQQMQRAAGPRPEVLPPASPSPPALVAPKPTVGQPSAGAQNRAGHFSPYHQQIMNNLNRLQQANHPAPAAPQAADKTRHSSEPKTSSPVLLPPQHEADAAAPTAARKNANFDNMQPVGRRMELEANDNPYKAHMQRANAILAKYGQFVDPKAKETIHAYMRRKQEEYVQRQKAEQARRERLNELRQRELRRVLGYQRYAAGNHVMDKDNKHANHRSPPDRHREDRPDIAIAAAGPTPKKPSQASPRSSSEATREAPSSEARSPRRQTPPTTPQAFGRDPRLPRPTSPAAVAAAAAAQRALVAPKPAALGASPHLTPHKVALAANSPQYLLDNRATGSPPCVPQTRSSAAPSRPSSCSDVSSLARRRQRPRPVEERPAQAANGSSAAEDSGDRFCFLVRGTPQVVRPLAPNAIVAAPPLPRRPPQLAAVMQDDPEAHHMAAHEPPHGASPRRLPSSPAVRPRRDSRSAGGARRGSGNGVACVPSARPKAPPLAISPTRHAAPSSAKTRAEYARHAAQQPLARSPRAVTPTRRARDKDDAGGGAMGAERGSPRWDAQGRRKQPAVLSPLMVPVPSPNSPVRATEAVSPARQRPAVLPPVSGSDTAAASSRAELVDFAHGIAPALTDEPAQALRPSVGSEVQVGTTADVPTRFLYEAPDAGGNAFLHRRVGAGEAARYAGMGREPVYDGQLLAQQRGVALERAEPAMPSTLQTVRDVVPPRDDGVKGVGYAVADPLTLLKQRQRQQGSLPSPTGAGAAPRATTTSGAAQRFAAVPINALSLGELNHLHRPTTVQGTAVPQSAIEPEARLPPAALFASSESGGALETGETGEDGRRTSLDGYAEMLRHLKELLQRRRTCHSPVSPRRATPPVPPGSPSQQQQQNNQNVFASVGEQGALSPSLAMTDASGRLARSPPNLTLTRPLERHGSDADEELSSAGADAEREEDDDDFEDAVPLSPVRCAELNDALTCPHTDATRAKD